MTYLLELTYKQVLGVKGVAEAIKNVYVIHVTFEYCRTPSDNVPGRTPTIIKQNQANNKEICFPVYTLFMIHPVDNL